VEPNSVFGSTFLKGRVEPNQPLERLSQTFFKQLNFYIFSTFKKGGAKLCFWFLVLPFLKVED